MLGGWVRYNFGPDEQGRPCYSLCEIVGRSASLSPPSQNSNHSLADVGADLVPTYKFDNVYSDRQLELRHAEKKRAWNMDRVSNAPFQQV